MRTPWDYTSLARAYLRRPSYAPGAIREILERAGIRRGDPVCDVGAGVAHLTLPLAEAGLEVTAVEPNDAMRALGLERTKALPNVAWHEGTGESTGQPAGRFKLVTFGSSFNVTDQAKALRETSRILAPRGWFVCLWNHRRLDDPLQARIEAAIKSRIPAYDYGKRREDQTAVIDASGLFGPVSAFEAPVVHRQAVADVLEAWRSHATLQRQAGEAFDAVLADIQRVLEQAGAAEVEVPYTTRVWLARKKA